MASIPTRRNPAVASQALLAIDAVEEGLIAAVTLQLLLAAGGSQAR